MCAECGKHLRTLQRRGDDWYCGVCGPVREPCGECGQIRPIYTRDRDGNPRCVACPPDGGRDPLELAVDVIAAADAALSTDVAAAAVRLAAPRSGHRHQLAWALQDRPELLTGAGAEAPIRSVLRLIDSLCDAGASAIIRPPCPRCGRIIHLHRRIDGKWLCRNCTAKSRAQPCARCGAVREAATRDELGRPLCAHCLITDPANRETCVQCGRRRPVAGPNTRRAAVWQVRTSLRADLRGLRADRSVRGLQGHRPTLVLRVQAEVDPLRWLRRGRSAARRNSRRAVVLVVHSARQRLAQLPQLRPTRTVPPRAVRSLLRHETPARTARRRHRHHPGRPGSPLPGAGRDRAARHAERLARQKLRAPDAA